MTYTKMTIEFDLNAEFDLDLSGRSGQEAHEAVLASILKMPVDPKGSQIAPYIIPARVSLPGTGTTQALAHGSHYPADEEFPQEANSYIDKFLDQAQTNFNTDQSEQKIPGQAHVQALVKHSLGLKSHTPEPFHASDDPQALK